MEEEYDEEQIVSDVDFEKQALQQKNLELAGALTGQGMMEQDNNLINYQLETDKILERCEHFLRGDQVKFNKNGSYYSEPTKNVLCKVKKDPKGFRYYFQEIKENKKGSETSENILVRIENKEGKEVMLRETDSRLLSSKLEKLRLSDEGYKYAEIIDEDQKPFNEYGVSEIMRILSMYVTKETFLSYYEEERINEIMGDLGDSIADFIHCNMETMGMDNKFKESKYHLIVLNILHVIESCYRRALEGGEQENLRTRAIVTQSQGINNMQGMMARNSPKKKWNPLKPNTW